MFTLHNGDCLEYMDTMQPESIDCVITDPPYSVPTQAAFGRKVIKRLSDLAIQEFYFSEIKKRFERILKPNAPVFIFCDDAYYPVLFALFYEWQQTNLIIWNKGRIGMGNPFRRKHELLFYANRESITLNDEVKHIPTIVDYTITKKYHGAEKPVKLIERFINSLVPQNGVVFDPFMGSGSTGVACLETGRSFVGVELEKSYFEIAQERVSGVSFTPSNNRLHLTGGGLPATQSSFTAEVIPPAKLPAKSPRR